MLRVYRACASLVQNIAYAERAAYAKIVRATDLIDEEVRTHSYDYLNPTIGRIFTEGRIDAGYYAEVVFDIFENIKNYRRGSTKLLDCGFTLKRGPNLAKRDMGRSIITEIPYPQYHALIYPSDISEQGYVAKTYFIGARNPIWHLGRGDILFSAEGTVGRTFVVCDDTMRFTTNFHGLIISPRAGVDLSQSIYIGLFLTYLKRKQIFDKISVGGQGGSFASSYWGKIYVPNLTRTLISELNSLYFTGNRIEDPFCFCHDRIAEAGIYELNKVRTDCIALLSRLIEDIKDDTLKSEGAYRSYPG